MRDVQVPHKLITSPMLRNVFWNGTVVCITFWPAGHLKSGCLVGYTAITDKMVKRESLVSVQSVSQFAENIR
jgi:hypothetical protein